MRVGSGKGMWRAGSPSPAPCCLLRGREGLCRSARSPGLGVPLKMSVTHPRSWVGAWAPDGPPPSPPLGGSRCPRLGLPWAPGSGGSGIRQLLGLREVIPWADGAVSPTGEVLERAHLGASVLTTHVHTRTHSQGAHGSLSGRWSRCDLVVGWFRSVRRVQAH